MAIKTVRKGYLETPIACPISNSTRTAFVSEEKLDRYLRYGPAHKFYEANLTTNAVHGKSRTDDQGPCHMKRFCLILAVCLMLCGCATYYRVTDLGRSVARAESARMRRLLDLAGSRGFTPEYDG